LAHQNLIFFIFSQKMSHFFKTVLSEHFYLFQVEKSMRFNQKCA
jgi:hypothetical protein